ncbi:MAG: hypothetical protein EBZ61_06795 [Micrococcales bacterium]|nr:hypothetical protein [Micrococcales bacterium]
MRNSKWAMGDLGITTRPISFAPAIKSNKEKLLKKFKENLGAKGYGPAEAAKMADKVRAEANALALEVNARQANDDPVRMANIHTMALKMKIAQTLKSVPAKQMAGMGFGRLSKTSPMKVSVADSGKAGDTHDVKRRAKQRRAQKESQVYDMELYRKKRGILKDDILNEAKRASYMNQFNGLGYYGALGHYHGGMGFSLKKAVSSVKSVAAKVAAPVQKAAAVVSKPIAQAAKYTVASTVRAAEIVKKDPIGAIAKVTVAAPFTIVASIAPKGTIVGDYARKAESGTVQAVKVAADFLGKILSGLKDLVLKALSPITNLFKKAFDGMKSVIIDKVAARFTGGSVKGFGSLPEDEKKKLTELTEEFAKKKALEAAGVQTTILGAAATTATATATATVTAAAAAGGPAAPATAAAAAAPAAASAAAAATPTATTATTVYITKLTGEGVQDISTEFAKYKAQKVIPNPVIRSVVNAGIDGKIPTDKESVSKMIEQLPAQAQQKVAQEIQRAPEAMKQEIIKKTFVPAEFKPSVDFLPKEAKALAVGKPAIPQLAIAESMQKAYAANPKLKELSPQQAKEQAALGVAVQDEMAISFVKEGKMNMTEGLVASSKIGKEQAIKQLPPEVRPQVVAELKKEMSNTEVARIDQKVADDKAKSSGAILTAAAIAAKVLLF